MEKKLESGILQKPDANVKFAKITNLYIGFVE
jgi:hypothetical protein